MLIVKSKEVLLENLNESDDQPAARLPPQLPGSHLQENLHVLQDWQPGEESLLGQRLDRQQQEGKVQKKLHFNLPDGQEVMKTLQEDELQPSSPRGRRIAGLYAGCCRWTGPAGWRQSRLKIWQETKIIEKKLSWPIRGKFMDSKPPNERFLPSYRSLSLT